MVVVVASVPWLVLLRECFSTGGAVASVILADLWLILSLTMLTAALRLPMLATVLPVWIVLGIAGACLCARLTALKTPSIPNAMVWLPALAGSVAWFCAMIANDVLSGSAKLSWVMRGDSANNVLFAREIIYRGGIGVGINENPVPLPPALMAISMALGRPYVPSAALLRHDIAAFAQVWVLLIALTCLLVGVAAAAITRAATERPVIIGVVSAAASLLPCRGSSPAIRLNMDSSAPMSRYR